MVETIPKMSRYSLLPLSTSSIETNMEKSFASRLELLRSATLKSEQDVARQRQMIENLRTDGHRTTEAEAVLQRFEASRQGLLAKLASLQQVQAAAD